MTHSKIIGPFTELLTMRNLPLKGALGDTQLEVIKQGALLIKNEIITEVGPFDALKSEFPQADIEELTAPNVAMPGFIDVHTHMCWAGSRARDYTLRTSGTPYLEIAKAGGGILDTVRQTRVASQETLTELLVQKCMRHLNEGVTTCEVKSGYGLTVADELKMLRAINGANKQHNIDIVPTCLAAHMPPQEFQGHSAEYLELILHELLPQIQKENLASRVDIFIEESAFTEREAEPYLRTAKAMGFSLAIHVDQFTAGSSLLACKLGAVSADHLEASTGREIEALAKSETIAVVLPGCSLGLGLNYAPARKLLDGGAALAIATDWNPGSAPMGDLLMQAAVLGAAEKLSATETFAGITTRAAAALERNDRGELSAGKRADFQVFPCDDYREILYNQGKLKASKIWKCGILVE
ncbi:MAG: imidazolonepropionase [Deferribacteres bacterium]|nr:imidazolonepropionase [candidate division KSB1 bacterium]MCB9501985.1 imidazolonepropionase [Deferribacteres bacterium]